MRTRRVVVPACAALGVVTGVLAVAHADIGSGGRRYADAAAMARTLHCTSSFRAVPPAAPAVSQGVCEVDGVTVDLATGRSTQDLEVWQTGQRRVTGLLPAIFGTQWVAVTHLSARQAGADPGVFRDVGGALQP